MWAMIEKFRIREISVMGGAHSTRNLQAKGPLSF